MVFVQPNPEDIEVLRDNGCTCAAPFLSYAFEPDGGIVAIVVHPDDNCTFSRELERLAKAKWN